MQRDHALPLVCRAVLNRDLLPGVRSAQSCYSRRRDGTYVEAAEAGLFIGGECVGRLRAQLLQAPAEPFVPLKKSKRFSQPFVLHVEAELQPGATVEVRAALRTEAHFDVLNPAFVRNYAASPERVEHFLASDRGLEHAVLLAEHQRNANGVNLVGDVEFANVEFAKPTDMTPRSFVFELHATLTHGNQRTSLCPMVIIYNHPTIAICVTRKQWDKAVRRLHPGAAVPTGEIAGRNLIDLYVRRWLELNTEWVRSVVHEDEDLGDRQGGPIWPLRGAQYAPQPPPTGAANEFIPPPEAVECEPGRPEEDFDDELLIMDIDMLPQGEPEQDEVHDLYSAADDSMYVNEPVWEAGTQHSNVSGAGAAARPMQPPAAQALRQGFPAANAPWLDANAHSLPTEHPSPDPGMDWEWTLMDMPVGGHGYPDHTPVRHGQQRPYHEPSRNPPAASTPGFEQQRYMNSADLGLLVDERYCNVPDLATTGGNCAPLATNPPWSPVEVQRLPAPLESLHAGWAPVQPTGSAHVCSLPALGLRCPQPTLRPQPSGAFVHAASTQHRHQQRHLDIAPVGFRADPAPAPTGVAVHMHVPDLEVQGYNWFSPNGDNNNNDNDGDMNAVASYRNGRPGPLTRSNHS